MTQQTLASSGSVHPHPVHPGQRRKSKSGLRRLIAWEWGIVLVLLSGLVITLLAISHGPDPKHQAAALVDQFLSVADSRPIDNPLYGVFPVVAGEGRDMSVTMGNVPPKICVLASWDLYRRGGIAINGVTAARVSAAKLVELCNVSEKASVTWFPNAHQ